MNVPWVLQKWLWWLAAVALLAAGGYLVYKKTDGFEGIRRNRFGFGRGSGSGGNADGESAATESEPLSPPAKGHRNGGVGTGSTGTNGGNAASGSLGGTAAPNTGAAGPTADRSFAAGQGGSGTSGAVSPRAGRTASHTSQEVCSLCVQSMSKVCAHVAIVTGPTVVAV